MKLNLGCCDSLLPSPWVNVDIHPPADQFVDLSVIPWPWPDNSVSEIRAWDLVEHLPKPHPTMNEAWRVLKPQGVLDIIVPTTDGRGWAQDPGHICFPPWNRNSFFYYEHNNPHLRRFSPGNGVQCAFRVVSEEQQRLPDEVVKLHIKLAAVK